MLGHPLRYEIVMKLGERPATCRELAEELDEDIKRIYEAIDALRGEGLVEVVAREAGPDGGRVSRFSATRHVFDAEEWAELPSFERETASFGIGRVLVQEMARSMKAGLFDSDPRRVLWRLPMWTDDEGIREVDTILTRAAEEITDVLRRSADRRSKTGEEAVHLTVAMLAFPTACSDPV